MTNGGLPEHQPWLEGRPDFTIGLRPIPPEAWLEGGEGPSAIRARKSALLASVPELVWAGTPGSEAAQAEAAALVAGALGQAITGDPPLLAAALEIPDDLCLMERRDGEWTLTALSLSAGTFFSAQQAIGRSLAQLHAPVPGFAETLLARVGRIFDKLPPDAVLERRNWTVAENDALHRPRPGARSDTLDGAIPLFVRVERQTLRRLPVTGGLLFTIRVWTRALEALGPAGALDGFGLAWRTAPPAYRSYKGLSRFDAAVERVLAGAGVLATGE